MINNATRVSWTGDSRLPYVILAGKSEGKSVDGTPLSVCV
jgi:hypothetical protein